jgi:hypothetical protein
MVHLVNLTIVVRSQRIHLTYKGHLGKRTRSCEKVTVWAPCTEHGGILGGRAGQCCAAEFQKILDHSGIVWNCWTGALARLGVARANALQAKTSQGADADAARVRALAAYKDFLTLWKDADPDIPIPEGSQSRVREAAITVRT